MGPFNSRGATIMAPCGDKAIHNFSGQTHQLKHLICGKRFLSYLIFLNFKRQIVTCTKFHLIITRHQILQ